MKTPRSPFVSRAAPERFFVEALVRHWEDPRTPLVLNVVGHSGVGKTYLLWHLPRLVRDISATKGWPVATGWVDEEETGPDVPAIMEQIAGQLEDQGEIGRLPIEVEPITCSNRTIRHWKSSIGCLTLTRTVPGRLQVEVKPTVCSNATTKL